MRVLFVVLALLAPALAADEFGRVLRRAKSADRYVRRQALQSLADGTIRPATSGQRSKLSRTMATYLTKKSLGTDRALAVQALGRIQSAESYGKLARWLKKERDDRALDALEAVFAQAPEEWFDTLISSFRKTKPVEVIQRAIYLRMAGANKSEKARALIRTRAKMIDHWVIHATAVEALRRDKSKAVLPLCMELLDIGDRAVSGAALQVLSERTGKRFGRDFVAWKTWWKTRELTESLDKAIKKAEDIAPTPRPETKTVTREEQQEPVRSYFFGMPLRGRKVVFVFDISASMRKKLPLALQQLMRAIKALPPRSRFEVIFFNEFVWPWRSRLSRADPVTKALLIEKLKNLEIKSYTNLFDAIERGLRMEPDEIFVISDGTPNRGRKKFTRDILNEIERLNPNRRVAIHCVSVVRTVDGDDHVDLLRKIAAANRGQSVQRTLY